MPNTISIFSETYLGPFIQYENETLHFNGCKITRAESANTNKSDVSGNCFK